MTDLSISNYLNLESITIKASTSSTINTLEKLNSLTISKNPLLKSIVVEDGYGYSSGSYYGGCVNVKSVSLTSLIDLIQLIRSSSIDNIHCRISFIL